MRMLEELLECGSAGMRDLKGLREAANTGLEIFRIDNVAEYLYAQTDQEVWNVKKDFPCLAPPFSNFWMEFGRPSKIVSSEHGMLSADNFPYRVGLWFMTVRREEIAADRDKYNERVIAQQKATGEFINKLWTPEVQRELQPLFVMMQEGRWNPYDKKHDAGLSNQARMALNQIRQYGAYQHLLKHPGNMETLLESVQLTELHWMLVCSPFVQLRRHGEILGPLLHQNLQLDEKGCVINVSSAVNLNVVKREKPEGLDTLWFPGLLAISFCHCKNVTVRVEEKPGALKQRQVKAGHRPLAFKVLEITPMKQVLRQAGAETTGLRRALHICRGHFANYGEKGLFGKYRGQFWIPQHVRGSVDAGLTVKDYAVNPPNKDTGKGE